jgi:hypothetical protein
LELHGRELEPGMSLSVLISDPQRKKTRTDVDVDEREVKVDGLSRFVKEVDLRKLFEKARRSRGPFGLCSHIFITDLNFPFPVRCHQSDQDGGHDGRSGTRLGVHRL